MVNSINKGKNGEREFCIWLEKNFHLPERPKRNLEQTREGGYDIYVKPFLFEVKRVEKIERDKWWKQVVKASEQIENSVPVVAYRQNRHKWNFLISIKFLCYDFEEDGYLEIKDNVFIMWAKNFLRVSN
jgi:hypothetical protein